MPSPCCVPNCNGNYPRGPKVSVFSFPEDELLKKKWVIGIQRDKFIPTKYSKVCALHFEPDQILREASAYDSRTGRTLTAPLSNPRLRKDAVPTIIMPPRKSFIKTRANPVKRPNLRGKKHRKVKKLKGETEKTAASKLAKLLQADTGTKLQNAVKPSFFIKQELVESTDELPPIVTDNILSVEGTVSSSSSSSFSKSSTPSSSSKLSNSSSPFPANTSPFTDPDSTNADETTATIKPKRKRKLNSVKSGDSDNIGSMSQAKLSRISKSPKRSSKPRPSCGVKKSAGNSSPSIEDTQKATGEILRSLLSGSESNPTSGSGTGEKPEDLFDVFGNFIAEKLREMNWNNCAFALKAILDIVFKAGQVQRSNGEEDNHVHVPGTSSTSPSKQK